MRHHFKLKKRHFFKIQKNETKKKMNFPTTRKNETVQEQFEDAVRNDLFADKIIQMIKS